MFEIDQNARRLSDEEKEQYIKEGYVTGLPVFSENAVNDLHNWYDELSSKSVSYTHLTLPTIYSV